MIQVRDEWINHALTRNGQIDEEAFEEGINWLYTDLLKLEKPKIVYCDSLLSASLVIYTLRSMKEVDLTSVKSSVDGLAWDLVREPVLDSVDTSVGDLVWKSARPSVRDWVGALAGDLIHEAIKEATKDIDLEVVKSSMGDPVWRLVREPAITTVISSVISPVRDLAFKSVRDPVGASAGDSVHEAIKRAAKDIARDSVKRSELSHELEKIIGETSLYVSFSDYAWVAFYDFFTRIWVVNHEKFNKYLKLIKSGVFDTFVYKNIVFAVRPPVEFKRNEQGRLHSYDAPAVTNRDGTVHYFIHGVNIKPDIWEKLETDTLTFDDFVQQKNEEVKAAILSYIEEKKGNEGVYRFISKHLKEVDTYVDKKPEKYLVGTTGGMNIGVYTLYKGTFGGLRMAYVRCYCPSSDRMFFLSVHPNNNNAKDAIASLYRIPRKLANDIKYIQRQGERFSTVFDEDGRKKLTRMSKEELSDLVHISGKKYFEKMRYEY